MILVEGFVKRDGVAMRFAVWPFSAWFYRRENEMAHGHITGQEYLSKLCDFPPRTALSSRLR